MRKTKKVFLLFLALISFLLFFSFLSVNSRSELTEDLFPEEEFPVKEVLDGDTIELSNGKIVRYLGIDTPELRWRKGDAWVYHPQLFAQEAKELNSLLVQGKKVKLEYDVEKRDKFNRLLAYVYVNGLMVNGEILRQGYALLDVRMPNIKHTNFLLKMFKEAKENKRGFWSLAGVQIISPQEVRKYSGKIKIIEGKITKIEDKGKLFRLTLNGEGQEKTWIIIYKNNLPIFEKKGISLERDYLHKKVRISGLICEYKQAYEIVAHHPAEIEIIE